MTGLLLFVAGVIVGFGAALVVLSYVANPSNWF